MAASRQPAVAVMECGPGLPDLLIFQEKLEIPAFKSTVSTKRVCGPLPGSGLPGVTFRSSLVSRR